MKKDRIIPAFQANIKEGDNFYKLKRPIIMIIENMVMRIVDGELPNPFEDGGSS
jgi:hypothetical protein